MGSLNKVQLIGNLGKEVSYRQLEGGAECSTFPVATSEKYRDKDGQMQEITDWHQVVVWGKKAVYCKDYLFKGSRVYIEGKLKNRSYQDKEGVKKYTTEVIVDKIIFLTSKASDQQVSHDQQEDDDLPF